MEIFTTFAKTHQRQWKFTLSSVRCNPLISTTAQPLPILRNSFGKIDECLIIIWMIDYEKIVCCFDWYCSVLLYCAQRYESRIGMGVDLEKRNK